jgi:hypothetical protein
MQVVGEMMFEYSLRELARVRSALCYRCMYRRIARRMTWNKEPRDSRKANGNSYQVMGGLLSRAQICSDTVDVTLIRINACRPYQ